MTTVSEIPQKQRAIVANYDGRLEIVDNVDVPKLLDDMIIVKTAAVALNPVDNKTQGKLSTPGAIAGTDFAGTVVAVGKNVSTPYSIAPGDRVCGAVQGMHGLTPKVGAFSEYVGATGHVTVKIPRHMTFAEGATLGSGLATIGVALFHSLQIPGHPDAPAQEPKDILIYGGSSSVGTLAIQLAKLSGLTVVTTCSPRHADMVRGYGADYVFDYRSESCIADIKTQTKNRLKFVLDCISEPETMQFCYKCLGRTGGRYTALEPFAEFLARERPTVKPDWVLGPTVLGKPISWPGFEREGDPLVKEFAVKWFRTAQRLLDEGKLRTHPIKQLDGGFSGIITGLELLKRKQVSGQKLVCNLDASFGLSEAVREIDPMRLDPRSDEEIIASLLTRRTVYSEKNVWTFWDKGLAATPAWLKRNLVGWVRRLGPSGWTVRVLDTVEGSPNNIYQFLDESKFHDAFNNGAIRMYSGAVASDILRLALLYEYGGIWMDLGTVLFSDLNHDIWRHIEDPSSPYEIAGFATDLMPTPGNDVIMSYFIAARKGNPFIDRWHKVMLELWKGRVDGEGLSRHPLLKQVDLIEIPANLRTKNQIDQDKFNDYVHVYLAAKRVRMIQDPDDGWDGPSYWEEHAMILPVQQSYMMYVLTNFDGRRQFELLSRQRDGIKPEDRDEEWHKAEKLVQATTSTLLMKLSHGMKNNKTTHLAAFWDQLEYADHDIKPSTFAAHLRWASLHLERQMSVEPFPIPTTGRKLQARLLEVVP